MMKSCNKGKTKIPSELNLSKNENEEESGYHKYISRCSSGVERFLGKEEVTGSNPVIGSIKKLRKKMNLNTIIYN